MRRSSHGTASAKWSLPLTSFVTSPPSFLAFPLSLSLSLLFTSVSSPLLAPLSPFSPLSSPTPPSDLSSQCNKLHTSIETAHSPPPQRTHLTSLHCLHFTAKFNVPLSSPDALVPSSSFTYFILLPPSSSSASPSAPPSARCCSVTSASLSGR